MLTNKDNRSQRIVVEVLIIGVLMIEIEKKISLFVWMWNFSLLLTQLFGTINNNNSNNSKYDQR